MTTNEPKNKQISKQYLPSSKSLSEQHLSMIEEALAEVGEYGEVRLVIEKHRLRFIITHKSYDVLKWLPGSIE